MQNHGIPLEEEVFYYKLKGCLAARKETLFIRCVHDMCSALPLVHQEETLSALNEFTQMYVLSMLSSAAIRTGECSPAKSSTRASALSAVSSCDESRSPSRRRWLWPAKSSPSSRSVGAGDDSHAGSQASDAQRMENFEQFKLFLRENGPYDIFVDGANIAHYKQNFEGGSFNYEQIDLLTSHLQKQGYKVLIVLHEHHFDQQSTDLPEVRCREEVICSDGFGRNSCTRS